MKKTKIFTKWEKISLIMMTSTVLSWIIFIYVFLLPTDYDIIKAISWCIAVILSFALIIIILLSRSENDQMKPEEFPSFLLKKIKHSENRENSSIESNAAQVREILDEIKGIEYLLGINQAVDDYRIQKIERIIDTLPISNPLKEDSRDRIDRCIVINSLFSLSQKYQRISLKEIGLGTSLMDYEKVKILYNIIKDGIMKFRFIERTEMIEFGDLSEEIDELLRSFQNWESLQYKKL